METSKKRYLSTYIFFIWLVVIVADRILDFSFFYIAVSLGIVIFHVLIINDGKFALQNIAVQNIVVKIYFIFLLYEFVITMICIVIDYSPFLISGLKTFFVIPCLTFFLTYYFNDKIDWIRLLDLIRKFGAFTALIAIFEVMLMGKDHRAVACYYHPIIAAFVFLSIFIIFLYYPLKKIFLQYIFLGGLLFALYGTKSRSSWIALLLILVLILLDKISIKKRIKRRLVIQVIEFLIVLFIIVVVFHKDLLDIGNNVVERFSLVIGTHSTAKSRVVRLTNMENVIVYILKYPIYALFGRGNSYANRFSDENPVGTWKFCMDNQYLTFILNTGLIGFSLIIAIFICYIYKFFSSKDNLEKMFLLMGIANLATCFFYEGLDGWRVTNYFFCITLFYKTR